MEFLRPHAFILLLVVLCAFVPMMMARERRHHHHGEGESGDGDIFVLRKSKQVYKTEAGELRAVRGFHSKGSNKALQIGFISMEPKSLFIPQYINANLILFVRRGETKVGWIYKDRQVEKELKTGDVYSISAGSTFYLINTSKGQRLQIICSFDTKDSDNTDMIQSFFIGGGSNPQSILAGFDSKILSASFNVSEEALSFLYSGRPSSGPFVYIRGRDELALWESIMKFRQEQRSKKEPEWFDHDEDDQDDDGDNEEDKHVFAWVWRKLLRTLAGLREAGDRQKPVRWPESYNLYESKPDYQNDYGWCIALDETAYQPLKRSDIGVYLVNLTAGSIMAPHVNPSATEYGVVLEGSGTINIVFPNGSAAASATVEEGDVFWVPHYFPFSQVASRSGPFEFFGFTTSARPNWPRFLAGADSLLATMNGPELAAALGISQADLDRIIKAQTQSVILPSWRQPRSDF